MVAWFTVGSCSINWNPRRVPVKAGILWLKFRVADDAVVVFIHRNFSRA